MSAESAGEYREQVESGALWLGEWLRLHALERWPEARVEYHGAASGGSRHWCIHTGAGLLWLAATEPSLLEPGVRQIPQKLDALDWRGALVDAVPDGLLISTTADVFVWDRDRDRGTRLIGPAR